MNIAFFGDAICCRRGSKPVDTFVDLLSIHLGACIVQVGTGGGLTETGILTQISQYKRGDFDLAVVCHSFKEEDKANLNYANTQQLIDTWFQDNQTPVIHCVNLNMVNHEFKWGAVDTEIMLYPTLTRTHRVNATYEVSDNGIDYAGNHMAVRRLLNHMKGLGLINE